MKRFLLLLMLSMALATFMTAQTHAQTFSEWFFQGRTQKKYLLQQIAALEIYYNQIKKGFEVCQQGLHFIYQVKNGEFTLHNLFFTSLKKVNPKILSYARVADIVIIQASILKNTNDALSQARRSGQFNQDELDLFLACFTNLVKESDDNLSELLTITSDDALQMTDDERVKRIDLLYEKAQQQRKATISMTGDLTSTALLRLKQQGEIDALRKLSAQPN